MILFLKPYRAYLFLAVFILFFAGCKDEKEKIEPQKNIRAFLVYMAGDNNLSSYSYENLDGIIEGAYNHLAAGKLFVYQDARNASPQLIEIYQEGKVVKKKVVKNYPEQNSASGEVLSLVIQDAFGLYEDADSRGLMLWSHGTSWLPEDKAIWTRSFGQDGYDEMDISDLKNALPDSFFDFIIFDACLMSSVEVCYELKDKADYIVASPVEISADGFPYQPIIKDIFSEQPIEELLTSVCETYYDFYINQPFFVSGSYSYLASISLVKTSGLEELSLLCHRIVKDRIGEIQSLNTENIQALYHLWTGSKILFDFKDFYDQISTDDQKLEMNSLLEDIILFRESASEIYSSNLERGFTITKNSGMSTYIPQTSTPMLNAWYSDLDWGKAVYSSVD